MSPDPPTLAVTLLGSSAGPPPPQPRLIFSPHINSWQLSQSHLAFLLIPHSFPPRSQPFAKQNKTPIS
ncbi:hypothetical protein BJX66DRAFT_318796 [Aspergillus keveii]|uniref:Uncharacterized protein n=1 Tax=Aspergillus keveii TaxID=714993 RepID=A0ABR4FJ81_9EURO